MGTSARIIRLITASAVIIVLLCAAVGCSTVGGIRSESLLAGMQISYEAEFDETVKAARSAVLFCELSLVEDYSINDSTWMIIGQTGASLMSWGEMARVVIQKEGIGNTVVRVIARRKVATNVFARDDYPESIHSNIMMLLSEESESGS